jgi:hypothetical protein
MNIKKYDLSGPGTKFKRRLEWFPADTLEHFEKQPKEHQEIWNAKGPIYYDINQYGFRCGIFPEEECRESITFLGCSLTHGVGVHKEDTWPVLLSNMLELREINLGIPGGSTDSAFRVYNEWQPIHKSKITCLLLPPCHRMELIGRDKWLNIGKWSKFPYLTDEMLVRLLDPILTEVRVDRNTAAINWVAQETDSTLIIIDYTSVEIKEDQLGRDNKHPGEEWHKAIAEAFYDRIINL